MGKSNTSSASKEPYSADKLVALSASSEAIVSEDSAGINSNTMIKIGSIPVKASTLLPSAHSSLVAELFSIFEAGGPLDADGQYPIDDALRANLIGSGNVWSTLAAESMQSNSFTMKYGLYGSFLLLIA